MFGETSIKMYEKELNFLIAFRRCHDLFWFFNQNVKNCNFVSSKHINIGQIW